MNSWCWQVAQSILINAERSFFLGLFLVFPEDSDGEGNVAGGKRVDV